MKEMSLPARVKCVKIVRLPFLINTSRDLFGWARLVIEKVKKTIIKKTIRESISRHALTTFPFSRYS